MKTIRTRASIAFPPAQVWAVLADFRLYAEWNPLTIWADGEARLGARVRMRFVDAGGGTGRVLSQSVTIVACDPPQRLAWVGRIPLLFTGRHSFQLEPSATGTELLHGEDLSGLVPMTFTAERLARQTAAYAATNAALEQRIRVLTRAAYAADRVS